MAQGVDGYIKPAVEQRIDRVHPCVMGETWRIHDRRGPLGKPARREPLQPCVEDHQHNQAENESRERIADYAEYPCGLIKQTPVVDRRLHAGPYSADDYGQETE